MAVYKYRAITFDGTAYRRGIVHAETDSEISQQLRDIGLELIEAKKTHNKILASRYAIPRLQLQDALALCHGLHGLLSSGFTLPQALELMAEGEFKTEIRERLKRIQKLIISGNSAGEAFSQSAGTLSGVDLALLAASERAGNLPVAFKTISERLKWELAAQKILRKAIRYPIFLLCVALGVTSFMLGFVIPEISVFLSGLGQELPFGTKALLAIADALALIWPTIVMILLLTPLIAALLYKSNTTFRRLFAQTLLRLPLIGRILLDHAISRLTKALSTLLRAGLTTPEALNIATPSLANTKLEADLKTALDRVLAGAPLSIACTPLLPKTSCHMLRIAESTGTVTDALLSISEKHELEARQRTDELLSALEPALTILTGLLLLWVVMAVLGPIYGSLNAIPSGV